MNRRVEDIRLLRMEDTLNKITAKLNNGLTSRSKETAETVKKIIEKQNLMDQQIVLNTATTEIVKSDICEIKRSLLNVDHTQQSWVKLINRMLLGTLFAICSAVLWFVMHVDEIDHIVDHIETDILVDRPIQLPADYQYKEIMPLLQLNTNGLPAPDPLPKPNSELKNVILRKE